MKQSLSIAAFDRLRETGQRTASRWARRSERPPGPLGRRTRLALLTGMMIALVAAGSSNASEPWKEECASTPATPEIEQVIPPVPRPGKWRGKGFGDKRKLDVEIEECGRRITGMVGVRLKHVADTSIPLELDEDDGRYKASFTYTEGGATAVVTWDLEVESESRLTGRMTIMGRGDRVEIDLLEGEPHPELALCECEAVRERREALVARLAELENEGQPSSVAVTPGWTTDPETCAVRPTPLDLTLPTQASLEVLMGADWQGALLERERCCALHRAGTPPGDVPSSDEEIAALDARISALDDWLRDRCEQTG